jgi:hypothetical protein
MTSVMTLISLAGGAAMAPAQEKAMVHGEVVDLSCHMANGGLGLDYQACTQWYAKQGATFGVLTDRGELFLLLNQPADRSPYDAAKRLAGTQVQLTGKQTRKQGVAGLIIEAVERR